LLFTILLIREGAHDVVRAVAATGWWLAVIPAFHLLPLFLDSFEWWRELGEQTRPFRLCGRTQPHLGANEKNESDAGSRTAILGE